MPPQDAEVQRGEEGGKESNRRVESRGGFPGGKVQVLQEITSKNLLSVDWEAPPCDRFV